MIKSLFIVGAGGHAKVVAELVQEMPDFRLSGFYDDAVTIGTELFPGLPVLGKTSDIPKTFDDFFVVAIGNNVIRQQWFETLRMRGKAASLVHPKAIVSCGAIIGEGSVVLPGAVISFGAHIGCNSIIGSLCHIDHETFIGDHVYLRASTIIGSNSRIGDQFSSNLGQIIPAFSVL